MPLAESEKIPVTAHCFGELLSHSAFDRFTADEVTSLFRIGERTMPFASVLATILHPAPECGTAASFIAFWDRNIREFLELMIPNGKSVRDGMHRVAMQNCPPTFRFLVDGLCPFLGQEVGADGEQDPKAQLSNNFVWRYGAAPYVLGYYCHGSKMTLVAITAPRTRQGKPQVHDIVSVDLQFGKGRIANVRHLINLVPILLVLANPSFRVKKRSHCKS
ncbi:hypothetical protein EDC04DRAFT_644128 [Pisolithus marmoratus]|nr:hypothetical protein EDC04DRAFT_644128 [Pisolithus marmoratus]